MTEERELLTLPTQAELEAAREAIGEALDGLGTIAGQVQARYKGRGDDPDADASMEMIGSLFMFARHVDSYLVEAREMLDPLVHQLWYL
jgi:hypothetical protein